MFVSLRLNKSISEIARMTVIKYEVYFFRDAKNLEMECNNVSNSL